MMDPEITETAKPESLEQKIPKSKNPKRVAAGKASAEKRIAEKAELEALRKAVKPTKPEIKPEVNPSEITKLCPADKADQPDKPLKIPEKYVGLAYGFCFGLVGVIAYYYCSKPEIETKKPANFTTAKTARTSKLYDNPFDY